MSYPKIIQSIKKWEKTTILHIQNKNWDQIQLFSCGNNSFGDMPEIWLINQFLCEDFTKEKEDVLIRLLGNKISTEGWIVQLVDCKNPSISTIEYFISNKKIININKHSKNFSLIERIILTERNINDKIYLINKLLENGADVNTQNESSGNSILLKCVENIFDIWRNFDSFKQKKEKRLEYYILCLFLLERGADPLLDNKQGISTLSWLKDNIDHIEEEDKEIYSNIVKIIELYT